MKKSVFKSILMAVFAVTCMLVSCNEDTVLVTGVKITDSMVKLHETDATKQLIATIFPDDATNKNVGWKSSDETVASVNPDGLVTAKGAGRCVVTVTTDDGGIQSNCVVEVDLDVYVTDISLNKQSLRLRGPLGISEKLTATLAPPNADNKNISWSTSNPVVAQVSEDGTVTSISQGTCVISATTEYTTGGGEHTATCEVTVLVPFESATLNAADEISIGRSQQLSVIFEPSYAYNKGLHWSVADETVATVDQNGLISGLKIGSTTLTVRATEIEEGDPAFEKTINVNVVVPGILYEIKFADGIPAGFTAQIEEGNGAAGSSYPLGTRDAMAVESTVDGTKGLRINMAIIGTGGGNNRNSAKYRMWLPEEGVAALRGAANIIEVDMYISEHVLTGSGLGYYGDFQCAIYPHSTDKGGNFQNNFTRPNQEQHWNIAGDNARWIKEKVDVGNGYWKYTYRYDLNNHMSDGLPFNKLDDRWANFQYFAYEWGAWGIYFDPASPIYCTRIALEYAE